ncbi:DNA mismatch repair protein MSH3 isoform X1 [Ananas comosus]|uniref:DNA mismatch repair protein n=1 Tax=Ananas comosus TaxID=4615 RepID=A0A6P5E9A1_ANACO|nr:DNA mismatch repair protein MSH3 isoform X1 [Ananas comosus]
MGKHKQQVISRFFAPKPPPDSSSSAAPKPSPKITTTVSFSPSSKRFLQTLPSPSPSSKKPKPSPPSHALTLLPPPISNPSLHQKFLSKLLDPPSSSAPRTLPQNPKYTPLEQQVLELKSKYPDVLLMVEVGYKYRFFGDDAEIAARVLGIFAHVDRNFLTASVPTFRLGFHVRRLVGAGYKVGVVKQTETAGIKAHGPNRAGPFSRGLSALYTKATIEAAEDMGGRGEEGMEAESGNYLVCVVEKDALVENKDCRIEGGFDVRVGFLAVEVSTGDVIHGEFNDNAMRSGLEAVILSLSPAEILLGEPLSTATEKLLLAYGGPSSNVRVERTSRGCFKDGGALAEVMALYENLDDNALIVNDTQTMEALREEKQLQGIEGIMVLPELVIQALALAIRYLKEFGLERIICSGASFRPFLSKVEMTLSANTLQQLEVLKNNSDGSTEGSLLQIMNSTCTAFGSRLLKHWLTHPLCDRNLIYARLDAVSEISESMGSCRESHDKHMQESETSCNLVVHSELGSVLSSVLTMLGRSPDVQRGITRIFHRTATPKEFIGVIQAILTSAKQLQVLHVEDDGVVLSQQRKVNSGLLRRLICTTSSSTIIAHAVKLLSCLNKDAADQGDMLNLFITSNDQFPEVARGHIAVKMETEKLHLLLPQYQRQLHLRNLEFKTISGTTHLIELPSDVRVPLNWVKVSGTKKTIRYHPPEVLKALDELVLAKEELAVTCRTTWDGFLMGFGKYYSQFQAAVQSLAALDCLHSLSTLSRNQNYVRPVFVNDEEPSQIQIKCGRHPVLESLLGDGFVPNDTNLHADSEYCQIVTGPNMGGKSCYIRQVALIAIMAQVGSFVPASSARLHVLDGIYTRMGASDSIQQGTSTFFEELSEASHILRNCSSRSLVIIDELGRGTSTHDGVAIAYATLHYLLKEKKSMVLFVTHYPKILDIQMEFKSYVGAYHVSYLTTEQPSETIDSETGSGAGKLDQGEVTFLYKVVRGASDKSFGLNVARLAQLPPSCIARAAMMASELEAELSERKNKTQKLAEMPTQHGEYENLPKSAATSYSGQFKELEETFQKVLLSISSALAEAEPLYVMRSLKSMRDLAAKMLEE